MRIFLIGIFLLASVQAIASEGATVEGVRVYGHVQAVSKSDIHDAIKAFKYAMSETPASLDIVSHDEMHGYLRLHDLGWFTVERTVFVEPDGSKHPGWDAYGQGIRDFPQALRCIRTAHEVYIFPVATPLKPHRDNKHMRLVTGYARSILIDMLGYKSDWLSGLDDRIFFGKAPKSIGVIFRNGKDELVLFFHSEAECKALSMAKM